MTTESVFVQDGEQFTATGLALGPWSAGALHGGAPAALLVHVFAEHAGEGPLRPARITYEFVRPVPRGPLRAQVETVRPGRRVTVLDAVLRDGDGTEVVRARALLLVPSETGPTPNSPPPFGGPETGQPNDWRQDRRMFATETMDIRFIDGRFGTPGAATAWFRLAYPLIAGQPIMPLERLAAAGDFGNGIASVLNWDEQMFINPDLTLFIEREPVGEWVALQSEMRVVPGNIAVAESVLWDEHGRIGRAVQSLLVGPRPTAT